MDITGYIIENALILIPVLLILKQVIKSMQNILNWSISIALLIPGVLGIMAMAGWTAGYTGNTGDRRCSVR